MDDSLRNIFFAYDLVDCIFDRVRLPWVSIKETVHCRKSVENLNFDEGIGKAVYYCMQLSTEAVKECYEEMKRIVEDSVEKFSCLALSALDEQFPTGYTHESFVGYCAFIIGVASYLSANGKWYFGDFAAETIAIVLTSYTLTRAFQENGGFEGLSNYSIEFVKRLQEKGKAPEK